METGYEIEPERIGRGPGRRRPAAAIVVAVLLVGVVLIKPWAGPESPSRPAGPTAPVAVVPASPAPPVLVARPVAVAAAPVPDPTWPVTLAATTLATETATEAKSALGSLAGHAGTWGVGNAGVGPRMLRDEPWSDWTAVAPEQVDGPPAHVSVWPGTDLCADYPTIYDRPTLVAITVPSDVAPLPEVQGWWVDQGRVASLTGSVVQVSPPGDHGIAYLERVDRAPWPPGRYEFHVAVGSGSVALTVCLTRRG